jgi:hypothetical protein
MSNIAFLGSLFIGSPHSQDTTGIMEGVSNGKCGNLSVIPSNTGEFRNIRFLLSHFDLVASFQ